MACSLEGGMISSLRSMQSRPKDHCSCVWLPSADVDIIDQPVEALDWIVDDLEASPVKI